jgi:hypothetical protein|tara:strand:- start:659 stop:946 length:288 start_codon:yes stop_codon:yes gene_type:complete
MYGSLELHGDEVACPTSSGTATSFTDNTPDETLNLRFTNYGDANATIHYLNSGGVQIGSITLIAGASLLLHKRRTYHKFYATSADVKAVPCAILR